MRAFDLFTQVIFMSMYRSMLTVPVSLTYRNLAMLWPLLGSDCQRMKFETLSDDVIARLKMTVWILKTLKWYYIRHSCLIWLARLEFCFKQDSFGQSF